VWEVKDSVVGGGSDYNDLNNVNNTYAWSAGSPWKETGSAYFSFLLGLNSFYFAGSYGWRLPTLEELQSIVLDFPCTLQSCSCGSHPCIDGAFGYTKADLYWSSTTYQPTPSIAWLVDFGPGSVSAYFLGKTNID
jgi:hypothetical protein